MKIQIFGTMKIIFLGTSQFIVEFSKSVGIKVGFILFFGFTYGTHINAINSNTKEAYAVKLTESIKEFKDIQVQSVKGIVTDKNDVPLSGVNIVVVGTSKGTTTDFDGKYEIEAESGQELKFSSIGFEDQNIVVGEDNEVNVQMNEGSVLDEVIVVGYGTKKKINVTGAVAEVSSEKLTSRPVTNVTSALQGTMAGVTVQGSTGQPGRDNGNINIRGVGTLNNSSPMVLVDGVVASLNDVNPDDIESISVLKDAASASIYGSRAANGVVLVTTKKGKEGDIRVRYNAYVGKQSVTRLPQFVNSWEQAEIFNQAQANEGRPIKYSDEDINNFKNSNNSDEYPNTNWLDLLYNGSGIQQNHYVSLDGGSEKAQYLLSFGYFDQEGVVKHSGNDRYTINLNVSTKISDRLQVNGKVSLTRGIFEEPTNPYTGDFSQIVRQANRIGAMVPYKYSNGDYGHIADGNPIAWIDLNAKNRIDSYKWLAVADADFEVLNGFHVKPMISYRSDIHKSKNFVKDIQFVDHATGDPSLYQGPNSLTDRNEFNDVITLQALLEYERNFGDDHYLNILGGYSQEYTKFNWLQGYRQDFLNTELSELNAGPTAGQKATGSANELGLQSVFGRINYDFRSKYLIEGNLRYDGSSRFSKKNRWGVFPSFSAGWNVYQESFFEPLKAAVNYFKIRGSWGKLGNQNIGSNYPYIPTISSDLNYNFGGSIAPALALIDGANEDIKWETTTQTNIGADFAFLKNKLTLSADYFIKKTTDILLDIPVGSPYGISAPVQNAGAVENKGWEFELGGKHDIGDFSIDISANAAFINNKVTDLHGTDPIISDYTFMKVGYPINSFYGYVSEGIFQSQEEVDNHATQTGGTIAPGDIKYKDLNDDGVIDGNDRTYLGTHFPKVTYGINLGLKWKDLDATVFFQGTSGVKGFIQGEILGGSGDMVDKSTVIWKDAWTPENHSTKFPRVWSSYTQNAPLSNPSSFWVRSASYLRLKNLQIGYSLPENWILKIGFSKARLYYTGQNLFTSSSFYKWVDPEAPAGERGYTYPQVKINSIGLDLTF